MQLSQLEKIGIIVALTQTMSLSDGRMEERTINLIGLQNRFGISMEELQNNLSKVDEVFTILQKMQDEKKLFLFQNLCVFLIGQNGRFTQEGQRILLSVSRAVHMDDALIQKGLDQFKKLAENQ